jgi:tRNA A37 threonylcarbamoyladenosine modification protein TsaB
VELVGVSSLRALAEQASRACATRPAAPGGDLDGVLAVIDARRGEAFAAAYAATDRGATDELTSPRASVPEELGGVVARAEGHVARAEAWSGGEHGRRWLAVGDGAVRFRGHLEEVGVAVPEDRSPLHLVSAGAICDLATRAPVAASYETLVPDYRRRPDAEIALTRRERGRERVTE